MRFAQAQATARTLPRQDAAEHDSYGKMLLGSQLFVSALIALPLEQLEVGGTVLSTFDPATAVAVKVMGKVLLLLACVLAFFGCVDLGDALETLPTPRAGSSLKSSGAYSFVRHPMYAGVIWGCVGATLITGSIARAALVLLLFAILHTKMDFEEKLLREAHGHSNVDSYTKKVPHRVLPPFY